MTILHVAFTLVCSVSPINDWVGDQYSGSNCVESKVEVQTLSACEAVLLAEKELFGTVEEQFNLTYRTGLKGPWSISQECKSVMVDKEIILPSFGPPRR